MRILLFIALLFMVQEVDAQAFRINGTAHADTVRTDSLSVTNHADIDTLTVNVCVGCSGHVTMNEETGATEQTDSLSAVSPLQFTHVPAGGEGEPARTLLSLEEPVPDLIEDEHISPGSVTTDSLTLDGPFKCVPFEGSVSGSVTLDFSRHCKFNLTLTDDVTLENPILPVDGIDVSPEITWRQGVAGDFTVTVSGSKWFTAAEVNTSAFALTKWNCSWQGTDDDIICDYMLDASEQPIVIEYALSDQSTDLTTGTKYTTRAPFAFSVLDVRLGALTAPTDASIIVDMNEAGTSIFSTEPSIDATETSSETAATPPVISDASVADDAIISFVIDQVGSTVAGQGLTIRLYVTRD